MFDVLVYIGVLFLVLLVILLAVLVAITSDKIVASIKDLDAHLYDLEEELQNVQNKKDTETKTL